VSVVTRTRAALIASAITCASARGWNGCRRPNERRISFDRRSTMPTVTSRTSFGLKRRTPGKSALALGSTSATGETRRRVQRHEGVCSIPSSQQPGAARWLASKASLRPSSSPFRVAQRRHDTLADLVTTRGRSRSFPVFAVQRTASAEMDSGAPASWRGAVAGRSSRGVAF